MRAMKIRFTVALTAALGVAGCSTNPVTGRSQFMVVPESMAVTESAAAYNSMMGGLAKKKQIDAESERVARVREITDRLIAQAVRFRPDSAKWNWEVQVINDPKTVNAFCMAGGKMAIYTGMWEKLKVTDDEVAQVMGHEIGHALANHTQERMSIAYSTGIGIELAARAGYDPAAAVSLWDKMAKLGGTPPEFLSTHPSPEHRKERLKELGAKVQPFYLAAKEHPAKDAPHFLAAKEGVNERVVTRPGEMSREEYAAKAAKEADTMTFIAEPFDKFKRGQTVFDCRFQCSLAYERRKADWKRLHAGQLWRDLAVSVLQVGYLSDYSYFMLAEAARGLGLRDAATTYYKRTIDAGTDYGCGDDCEGFDVQRRARGAIALK